MKITDKMARILHKVQSRTSQANSLGGVAQWEIDGLHNDQTRTLNAMVKSGLLTKYRTKNAMRGKPNDHLFGTDGLDLYAVGPAGAAYLLDIAYAHEARSLERRMARRMAGVSPDTIRGAMRTLIKRHKGNLYYSVEDVATATEEL